MDINIIVHDLLDAGIGSAIGGESSDSKESGSNLALTLLARMLDKALEEYVRKEDFSEFVEQLKTLQEATAKAIETLDKVSEENKTSSENANRALTIAMDAKAIADKAHGGKSAFEIANELRPEGSKFKNEQEWIDYIENIREDKIYQTLDNARIYIQDKKITTPVNHNDWVHDDEGGYTCVIRNDAIKANQDVELINCRGGSTKFFDAMKLAVCDSIAEGEITIHIPECSLPNDTVEMDFILRECVLKKEATV